MDERATTVELMIQEMKRLIMRFVYGNDSDEEDFDNLVQIDAIMKAIQSKCEGLEADMAYYKDSYFRAKLELHKLKNKND